MGSGKFRPPPQEIAVAICLIITGGTFDKHYDELNGELTFKDTHLPEILSASRCTVPFEVEINQLIDSLEMQQKHRLSILDSCRRSAQDRIIITHGTDTMCETAGVVREADLGKTIVLTGAMIPYAVSRSDAVFNFGCAVTAVQLLPPGVYIVMNGRVFDSENVRKNRESGIFEPLRS